MSESVYETADAEGWVKSEWLALSFWNAMKLSYDVGLSRIFVPISKTLGATPQTSHISLPTSLWSKCSQIFLNISTELRQIVSCRSWGRRLAFCGGRHSLCIVTSEWVGGAAAGQDEKGCRACAAHSRHSSRVLTPLFCNGRRSKSSLCYWAWTPQRGNRSNQTSYIIWDVIWPIPNY